MAHQFSRRDFMKGAAGMTALAIATLTGGCELTRITTERIRRRPTRRDLTKLSPTHPIMETYRHAVTAMKALPTSDPRNWSNQADIHFNYCPHGNWYFLPWHRVYLHYFEEICRELTGDNSFALPYWNWTANPKVPDAFWGTSANPLFHSPRSATPASSASTSIVGPANMQSILSEPNFIVFASNPAVGQRDVTGYGRLEGGPHNHIHGFVGGTMGNFHSPLDPIFWTHHNMIECCWVHWNLKGQHPNTNDANWLDHKFTEFVDRNGNAVSITVNQTLLYPILLYQYEDCFPPPATGAKAMSDRELEEFVRRGARVKLDFLHQAMLREEATVDIDRPTSKRIPLKGDIKGMFLNPTAPNRVLLTIGEVELPKNSDLYVRVFVNKPDATPETSTDDPHYAGSFAFFNGHRGDTATTTSQFIVDVTDAMRRLQQQRAFAESVDPVVQLVAVPYPGREVQERRFRFNRLELGISRPPELQ